MEVCSILHLPEEILQNLFSYLPIVDRLTASLVCKQWLNAMNYPMVLKDMCVKIKDKDFAINHWNFSRKFSYFQFFNIEISSQHIEFLKEYGDNIKWLVFYNCRIQQELTESCYQQKLCENLNILEFHKCFFNIFPSLPELKQLHIIYLNGLYVCDRDIYEMGKTMLNLEKFVFHNIVVAKKVILNRFYPPFKKWSDAPSEQILSFSAVFDFIEKRSRTLASLDLFVDFEIKLLLELLAIEHLKLKRLSLTFSPHYRFVPEICQNQSTLIDINLSCSYLKDYHVKTICTLLPFLERLTIRGELSDSIIDIFQLRNLRTLNLNCHSLENESSFREAVDVFKANGLTKLDLNSANIDNQALKALLCMTPKLCYLSLASCRYVCDETVQVISKNLVSLRYLSLAGNSEITDQGIFCPLDRKLSITNIKGLQELNLLGCSKITPDTLQTAVKFLELHTLYVDYISTDLEEKLKKQNPSLKYMKYDCAGFKCTTFD